MASVSTMTYKFNVNGEFTKFLQAKRGIRQGDPISPMLFVLIMEYMNMIIGDTTLVEMMHDAFRTFTLSAGLIANPRKSKIYYGGIDTGQKRLLQNLIGFQEGELPVKYLGVSLTCKKLTIHQYLPLIEKIVGRIHHWTTKLLSYARRIQLVKVLSEPGCSVFLSQKV
ncbi:unnamed protein product [Lathyrus sativus]|nr:unnamed protein product [Lathyrus sativus]